LVNVNQNSDEYIITDYHLNSYPGYLAVLIFLICFWFIGFMWSFILGIMSGVLLRLKLTSEQKKQKKRLNKIQDMNAINDEDVYEGDVGGEDEDEEAFDVMTENFKSTYDEVSRKRRAMDKNYTPLTLDKRKKIGTFQGSSGEIYKTTPDSCTCMDFARNDGAKCKHIYRLEHELGIYDLLVTTPKESRKDANVRREAGTLLGDISRYWEFISLEDLKKLMNEIELLKLQQGKQ